MEFFLAKGLVPGTRHLDEGECLEVQKVRVSDLKQMVLNGEITDVKTIVGTYWLEKYLAGQMHPKAC